MKTWPAATRRPGHPQRILLSGVFGPYGVDDAFGRQENIMELFHNQVTKAQGLASLRFTHRSFGLYFIAANIEADVTVLDFPSRRRFARELRRGYDIVGISFITPNFAKCRDMALTVRRLAPAAVIVLGGHGAAIEGVEDLIDCDHVVRGEGIRWFREYLGQDPEAPLLHPALPSNEYHRVLGVSIPGKTAGLLVPGVGCANGCKFCSTSHFFGKAYHPFITSGRDLFKVAAQVADTVGSDSLFVMDENFLRAKDRAMELLHEMERHGRWFSFMVFSSADTIIEFGVQNLVRLGVELVWVGVESTTNAPFEKNAGIDHQRLVRNLRDHGISVLASGILCMEHHDRQSLREDIDYLVGLEADMVQFMLLTGLPVTALYHDHKERGLLRTDLEYEEWHGQKRLNYAHPEFPGNEPEHWLETAFAEDYQHNGSSIFRIMETAVRGYRTLLDIGATDPVLRVRAQQCRERILKMRPLVSVIRRFAANEAERGRVAALDREMTELVGPPGVRDRLLRAVAMVCGLTWALRVRLFGDSVQPRTLVTHYRAAEYAELRRRLPACSTKDAGESAVPQDGLLAATSPGGAAGSD